LFVMTRKEWAKLTANEKRLNVALCVGRERLGEWQWEILTDCLNGNLTRLDYIPDYLNDLNTMHKAEKQLLGPDGTYVEHASRRAAKYTKWLGKIIGWGIEHAWDATAAQRAEALVLTRGRHYEN